MRALKLVGFAFIVGFTLFGFFGCAVLGEILKTGMQCLPAFMEIGESIASTVQDKGEFDGILSASGGTLGCVGESLHKRRASFTSVTTPYEVKATSNLETGMRAVGARQQMLMSGAR